MTPTEMTKSVFKTGDKIELISEEQGWGKGEINGKTGLFPMNFVKEYLETDNKESQSDTTENHSGNKYKVPFFGKAKFDYVATFEDELTFKTGDIFRIIEECKDGWYRGTETDEAHAGLIPGNYIIPIDEETGYYLLSERRKEQNELERQRKVLKSSLKIKKEIVEEEDLNGITKVKVSFAETPSALRQKRKNKKILPPPTKAAIEERPFEGIKGKEGEVEIVNDEEEIPKEKEVKKEVTHKIETPSPRQTRDITLESAPLIKKEEPIACCLIL